MISEATINVNIPKILVKDNSRFLDKLQNPELPILYELSKIHKSGNNMRPIVSNSNAPSYKLAKCFVHIFTNFKCFDSFSIKNNVQLVKKLKIIRFESNNRLISFDVVALFLSFPINLTIHFTKTWLEQLEIEKKKRTYQLNKTLYGSKCFLI